MQRTPNGEQPADPEEAPERDPERAEKVANQRAKVAARDWIRSNTCRYMWTGTFAEEPADYDGVAQAVDDFYRQVADYWAHRGKWAATSVATGRRPLFLCVAERGEEHGRWHVHFATDRYLAHGLVKRLWGRGHVHVSGPSKRNGGSSPRRVARYVIKYFTKAAGDPEAAWPINRPKGAHRYWVTQGHKPEERRTWQMFLKSGLEWVRRQMGEWDRAYVFGLDGEHPLIGVVLDFPDEAIDGWKKRVQAVSRAQRGQP